MKIPPGVVWRPFKDAGEIACAAAREWVGLLRRRPDRRRPWCVALSGGRIAPKLYAAVVEETGPDRDLWDGVEFFFADERWVPLDDPESNYRLAREGLFDPLNIPTARRHGLAGPDREFAVAQAQARLLLRAPTTPEGHPIFDLVILGMGEDGHVASIFPQNLASLADSRAVWVPVEGPKPPPERLTLTPAVLAAAREA
ncbi:MAG: 6-phosphogluconolactonase, partial [Verrucomicrobia bacterium]